MGFGLGVGEGLDAGVAVGSDVAVACGVVADVAVGCAVADGSAVDVGMAVAPGVAWRGACGTDWAGIGHGPELEAEGAPGSQPFAKASSSARPITITVMEAPQPAPQRMARDSRRAASAERRSASRRRTCDGQRGPSGCVTWRDQCDSGRLSPRRRITLSLCCQTVWGGV